MDVVFKITRIILTAACYSCLMTWWSRSFIFESSDRRALET